MVSTTRRQHIDHSDTPIRLFESDFLEWFTHVTPAVVLVIWTPVVVYFFARGVIDSGAGRWWPVVPAAFVLGLVAWTFAEYTLHRFLFHFHATGERTRRLFFLFHGVHHAQPQLKTRLVMPPAVSIPVGLLFYGLFWLAVGRMLDGGAWVAPLFSGFMTGYLVYDLTHYATHHLPMRSRYGKFLKRHHMAHHFRSPDALYGVTSPVWDRVFGTREPAPASPPLADRS